MAETYQGVLDFWFKEIDPAQWWTKDQDFDTLIRQRFNELHRQAIDCELAPWRACVEGRLAEIIVLDQFSRNIFRDQAQSFTYDKLALALAQETVSLGLDLQLGQNHRSFLYMPYMHSESKSIHEQAELLFSGLGNENNLDFERKHKIIIDRFGRYPHRNLILERASTAEEIEFLAQPGSSF